MPGKGYYAPTCLACEGLIGKDQERITVQVSKKNYAPVRYRHASDADCARALRGGGGSHGASNRVDEADPNEYEGARNALTSRHIRQAR